MKIILEIPDAFVSDYNENRFEDALQRLIADANVLVENYEKETAAMLIKALNDATEVVHDPKNDYIRREDAVNAFIAFSTSAFEGVMYKRIIDKIPKADVSRIVRCKDCIHYDSPHEGRCEFHNAKFVNPKGYCYWGESKSVYDEMR